MEVYTLMCVLMDTTRTIRLVPLKHRRREVGIYNYNYSDAAIIIIPIDDSRRRVQFPVHLFSPPPPLLFAAKADFAAGVAERPRHSPYPLLPVDQALHIVLEHTPTLPAVATDNLIGNYSVTRNESCNCVVLTILCFLLLVWVCRGSGLSDSWGYLCTTGSSALPCLRERWICRHW